jgi:A/G-specific adenine glycosylase
MTLTRDQISVFQRKIFTWWKVNKRDLPWRHTHDPYKILVSEVMLQQTQVLRSLPKYLEFIKAYPTVVSLAKATPADVLKLWKGMGYNRRALYLHNAAKTIAHIYKGKFPKTEQELSQLPGLGKYTARAILVFAYKQDIAMVDTNIRQIITHFFFHDIPQPEKEIQNVADQSVPVGKSWEWHQALMDYGALELVKRKRDGVKKKTVPFKETNRYSRGRILDLLRERKWKRKHLYEKMIKLYGKDTDFYFGIFKGLEKDGLISSSKTDIISLPE